LQVRCAPEDAYGPYDETNVVEVPLERMPEPPPGLKMEAGLVLQVSELSSFHAYAFYDVIWAGVNSLFQNFHEPP
jgi:FKBP-type peptidyl-prolyl cis-trans isomerase 2